MDAKILDSLYSLFFLIRNRRNYHFSTSWNSLETLGKLHLFFVKHRKCFHRPRTRNLRIAFSVDFRRKNKQTQGIPRIFASFSPILNVCEFLIRNNKDFEESRIFASFFFLSNLIRKIRNIRNQGFLHPFCLSNLIRKIWNIRNQGFLHPFFLSPI